MEKNTEELNARQTAEAEIEDGAEDKAREGKTPFRELITGVYRQEYEEEVGRRIQAAIHQRFRSRQAMDELTQGRLPAVEGWKAFPGNEGMRHEAMRRHFLTLSRQAAELRKTVPDFDLLREMNDPGFARLTAPGTGVSVRDAFYALHGADIQRDSMAYAAQKAGERIAASVRAGASRPLENGMERSGGVNMALDISGMDRKTREEYRRRIRSGERIDFINNL